MIWKSNTTPDSPKRVINICRYTGLASFNWEARADGERGVGYTKWGAIRDLKKDIKKKERREGAAGTEQREVNW